MLFNGTSNANIYYGDMYDDVLTEIKFVNEPFKSEYNFHYSGRNIWGRLNGTVLELYTDAPVLYIRQTTSAYASGNVTGGAYMFYGFQALKKVDLSKISFAGINSCNYMFCQCLSLENIDLSGIDVSNVGGMLGMFAGCTNLKSVNMAGWDTSKLQDVSGMFYRCTSLESIDLSSWNTSCI